MRLGGYAAGTNMFIYSAKIKKQQRYTRKSRQSVSEKIIIAFYRGKIIKKRRHFTLQSRSRCQEGHIQSVPGIFAIPIGYIIPSGHGTPLKTANSGGLRGKPLCGSPTQAKSPKMCRGGRQEEYPVYKPALIAEFGLPFPVYIHYSA